MEKKKIKIGFCGFWSSFNPENNEFTNILKNKYDVVISDNPDYLFVSPLGNPYEHMKYDCIKIAFQGEELTPDFSMFDYAIGFDYLSFGDRYIRYPLCFFGKKPWHAPSLSKEEARCILKKKDIFCNLIYNEDSIGNVRSELFALLNKYKRTDSYGRFINSVGGQGVSHKQKREILRRSKFTVAVEGCNYPGVATEKITQPFEEHSVPIFYGNNRIENDFSPKSFINCHAFSSLEEAVEEVIRLDNDDEAYIEMLTSSPLIYESYTDELFEQFVNFLYNIFDQDYDDAKRRVESVISENYSALYRSLRRFVKLMPARRKQ